MKKSKNYLFIIKVIYLNLILNYYPEVSAAIFKKIFEKKRSAPDCRTVDPIKREGLIPASAELLEQGFDAGKALLKFGRLAQSLESYTVLSRPINDVIHEQNLAIDPNNHQIVEIARSQNSYKSSAIQAFSFYRTSYFEVLRNYSFYQAIDENIQKANLAWSNAPEAIRKDIAFLTQLSTQLFLDCYATYQEIFPEITEQFKEPTFFIYLLKSINVDFSIGSILLNIAPKKSHQLNPPFKNLSKNSEGFIVKAE